MKRLALVTAMVGTLLAAACSSGFSSEPGTTGPPSTGPGLTRTADASGIAVEATWLTAQDLDGIDADVTAYPLDEFLLVEIRFTTHSGDLNEIDMEQASLLRQEGVDVRPEGWVSLSDDPHHRAGVLVFPRRLENGPVELTIDIGGEELAMHWETAPIG